MADGVHKYPIDPTLTTGAAGTADGNAGVNLTEGVTQVNAINNAMRGLIGDIGSWRDDVSGANTTTGSANTYVLATTSGMTSLQDGLTLTFLINVTNTGASTLNVDTLGAKKLLASGASLVAGNLVAGQPVTVVYDASADSSAGAWLVANPVPVAASVSYDSDDISNVSTVSGANVSDALETNAASILLKAPLADPTFTGVPAAPTAAADTNTTQIATTAYVQTELGDYALLASPALTGNPTAPTQALGNNSTRIATTAFVLANASGGVVIGHARATNNTRTTITAVIPSDDTIPQNTEGVEVLTVGYTPLESNSTLLISVSLAISASGESDVNVALFNGEIDAIAARIITVANANWQHECNFVGAYAPGSTSLQTISVRAGQGGGGAFGSAMYINGGSDRAFGGAVISSVDVWEIAA
jgi:hypothetical protein